MHIFASLRVRLILLLAAALLPLLVLILYLGIQEQALARQTAEDKMRDLVRQVASSQSTLIESTRQMLLILSVSTEISDPSAAACPNYLAAIVAKTPAFANLGVVSLAGDFLYSAVKLQAPVNIADRGYFQDVLRTGGFSVGSYQVERSTHVPTINLALPVASSGKNAQLILVAALKLDWLNQSLAAFSPDSSTSLLMIDPAGTLLARTPSSANLVGQTFADTLLVQTMLASKDLGTLETTGLDGQRRIYAYLPEIQGEPLQGARSDGAPALFVAVGTPSESVYAAANQRLITSLGGLLLGVVLAGSLAWLFSEAAVLRSMRRLVKAARRITSGDLAARTYLPYDESEPGQMARAFDEMASALQNSVRSLHALTDCNQAMMRAANEQELLDDICRILVEAGGYRMAWVGLASVEEGHPVLPVAWAGHEDGYLNGIQISWDDVPAGQGPTGACIRLQREIVNRNFATNPSVVLWHVGALQRGYVSSIALPLIPGSAPGADLGLHPALPGSISNPTGAEELVVGALTLYSGDPEAFTPGEISLLQELASDLAYGIQVLRNRTHHQSALEQLRTSEERFRAAFDFAAIGMSLTGIDQRLLKVNQALCNLLGYTQAELERMQFSSITYPDDQAASQQALQELLAGRLKAAHFEKRYLHRDGHILWALVSTILVHDAAGAPLYLITHIQDITARKAAEIEIESLARFPAEDPNPVLRVDRDGRLLYSNLAGRALLAAAGCLECSDIHPSWMFGIQKALESGHPAEIEQDYGPSSSYQLTFAPAPDGSYTNIYGRDITARRQAEVALRDSEKKFRSIFESMGEMVALHELVYARDGQPVDYRILEVNQAFSTLTGIPRRQAVGALASKLYGTGAPPYLEIYARVAQSGQPEWFETYFAPLQKHFSISVISPAPNRFATVSTDVTARRKAEEELQRLNADLELRVEKRTAELREKNRELETFTYSVSHDLKAPLRGIDGYSQLLLEDYAGKLDAEGRYFIESIRRGAHQMDQLITDLLTYSRLERRTMAQTIVNLQDIAAAVLSEFAVEIEHRGVQVVQNVPEVWVFADAESLVQALRNLVDNAIKFTRDIPQAVVEISATETEQAGTLKVRDNGIGFDMQYQERIFEIFQRLHRSEDYPGTGVGLAIVHRAMERLGGRAWAESLPGQGATFYLEIPKRPQQFDIEFQV